MNLVLTNIPHPHLLNWYNRKDSQSMIPVLWLPPRIILRRRTCDHRGNILEGRQWSNTTVFDKFKFTGKGLSAHSRNLTHKPIIIILPVRRSLYFKRRRSARYYDAWKAQWTTPDPLEDKYPGWSSYNYCGNNPVNRFDPDGRYYWNLTNDQVFEMKKTQAGLSTNYNYTNTGDGENPNNQESSVSITYDFVDLWPLVVPVSFELGLSTVGILTFPLLLQADDEKTIIRDMNASQIIEGVNKENPNIILRHYTNERNFMEIMNSNRIRANTKNQVYLTWKIYSEKSAYQSLFAGNPRYIGKGSHVIEIVLKPGVPLSVGKQANDLEQ